MPRFPVAWLDELRSRADIVQVISGYVPLKKNGHRYWGLCPFHGEKTASFSVDPELQLYYCFGCKATGTVIQFVMDMERLEYADAVKHLADQLHMPLPQMVDDPNYQRLRDQRDRLLAANKEAARFYHQMLFTEEGRPALEYLKRRGLSDSVIRKFGLGAAPSTWDTLTRHLSDMGYTQEELRLCGLTVIREAEPATEDAPAKPRRVFDMFRGRAIFPIIDQYGNVLAFGGRILGEGQPKYLNTSDTPIFNKRLGVYAANLLRKERHLERVVLVEGYMDVVALTQFGVRGVCATLGTALTPEQARLLRRFAPQVYLGYDGDSAGQHAILRGLDILAAEGIPARVLDFPDGLDPDEFIRRDGAEGFAALPSITPEEYRMRRERDGHDLSTQEGRTAYARACAAIIRGLEPVEMENHLQQLMVQTGFSREVLLAQIGVSPAPRAQAKPQPGIVKRHPPRGVSAQSPEDERAEEVILSIIATGRVPGDIASEEDFHDPLLKSVFVELSNGRTPASLVEEQQTEEQRERISRLMLAPVTEGDTDQLLSMARECLGKMRKRRIQTRIQTIQQTINTLPPAEKKQAMQEYMALQQRLKQLS
ncbi:MAG: DNA primase [bacterium]|nr:DNA primase [bacterium]